ncbi:MAG: endolytic transglycosylase MltG [Oscillospiraceae bacterium]|nr:endolytic transglycosylase MltG [Oscillospiraceae bacterium]
MTQRRRDGGRFNTTRWDVGSVREESERHEVRRRKKRFLSGAPYVAMILIISAIVAGGGWLLANDLLALNKEPKTAVVEIDEGDSMMKVAGKLKKNGLIEFRGLFLMYSAVSHAGNKITNGTYNLNTNMDYRALIVAMGSSSGDRLTVTVTVPEGYTVQQTIDLLVKNGVNTEDKLTDAIANGDYDYDFLADKEKGDISRMEGYLFPDTYEFYCGEDATKVVKKFLKNFNSKMDDDMMAQVEASGHSLDEIITVASLIEKETDGTDRAKIASVIYNRLKNTTAETAGFLQIDASLLYALPDHTGDITDADKETDSPYNLYKYKGLPPTPIANPGIESIKAALSPAKTSYYYYALGNDKLHHFFATYREHVNFLNSLS